MSRAQKHYILTEKWSRENELEAMLDLKVSESGLNEALERANETAAELEGYLENHDPSPSWVADLRVFWDQLTAHESIVSFLTAPPTGRNFI